MTERKIELMPYCEIDGIRTMRDSDVRALFSRMEKDGVVPMVFFDGEVQTADDFLYAMKFGRNSLYVVLLDGREAGCIWLNNFSIKSCHINFCYFSEFWGMPDKAHINMRCRDILIEQRDPTSEEFLFNVFFGILRRDNIKAIRLAELCGFQVIGELPNGIWNHFDQRSATGILVCYPREEKSNEDLH